MHGIDLDKEGMGDFCFKLYNIYKYSKAVTKIQFTAQNLCYQTNIHILDILINASPVGERMDNIYQVSVRHSDH